MTSRALPAIRRVLFSPPQGRLAVLLPFIGLFLCLGEGTHGGDAGELSPTSRPSTLTGEVRIHDKFHSRFLPSDRTVLVWLPPGYAEHPRQRYPVLYLHDGQNLFDAATSFIGQEWRADETARSLIDAGKIEPILLVGIYNTGVERINEYTPTPDPKGRYGGGKADLYGRLIVEELKPFIDRTYRTKRGAKDTGLGGSSLGGLVSLYLGLKYPKVFGKLAVLSPAAWWDDGMIVREVDRLPKKPPLKVWLDIGAAEGEETVKMTRRLRDALLHKGWKPGKDLSYVEAPGAQHNEAAWAGRLGDILLFLFPKRRS